MAYIVAIIIAGALTAAGPAHAASLQTLNAWFSVESEAFDQMAKCGKGPDPAVGIAPYTRELCTAVWYEIWQLASQKARQPLTK